MNPCNVNRIARRRLLGLALVTPVALALAACGTDETASSNTGSSNTGDVPGSTVPPDTIPPTTPPSTAVPTTYGHPTGADDVVLEISYEGGFVPREVAFTNLPMLLVTGDGRVITQGPQIDVFPGPLLPNVVERSITEDGIQELLALADQYGLLEPADYTLEPNMIADAPDTVVTVDANGTPITHRAYALGIDDGTGSSSTDRQRLADFVAAASDIQAAVADDQLGPEQPFAAESYRLNAYEAGDPSGYDVPPTIQDWPADASVRLADASECALVPAAEIQELFASATQLTWFTDDGVTYALAVAPFLPGDTC